MEQMTAKAKKLACTLSILGRKAPFIDAMKSEIGQSIIGDLMERHEVLLFKVADLEASDKEKIEFVVIRELITKWSEKIAEYNRKLREIETQIQ